VYVRGERARKKPHPARTLIRREYAGIGPDFHRCFPTRRRVLHLAVAVSMASVEKCKPPSLERSLEIMAPQPMPEVPSPSQDEMVHGQSLFLQWDH